MEKHTTMTIMNRIARVLRRSPRNLARGAAIKKDRIGEERGKILAEAGRNGMIKRRQRAILAEARLLPL